jgi:hypothetical protein
VSVTPQSPLERSVLERKERDELATIAEAMGVKASSRAAAAPVRALCRLLARLAARSCFASEGWEVLRAGPGVARGRRFGRKGAVTAGLASIRRQGNRQSVAAEPAEPASAGDSAPSAYSQFPGSAL